MPQANRRNDYDVTDTVQVSSPAAVRDAVLSLYAKTWPGSSLKPLELAFTDFENLFTGRMPGYLGVDTVYHDLQHSQDVVLAMARLQAGYELGQPEGERLGPERAAMGLVTAMFHDAGYIREVGEEALGNGAVFTRNHVTRSARFLARYLPTIGMGDWVPTATRIVHCTGYEVPLDLIRVPDLGDRAVGHLLGTADMLAQMADRCYPEKCRDRLYAEFVLGGVAAQQGSDGIQVRYGSGLDLLRQTPDFVANTLSGRLGESFNHAYRHLEPLYDGSNPYLAAINQHLTYLRELNRTRRWPMLRREPPVFTVEAEPMTQVRRQVVRQLQAIWSRPDENAS